MYKNTFAFFYKHCDNRNIRYYIVKHKYMNKIIADRIALKFKTM